jgi:vacuolar-type H+-ATPase subunit F/Vma7
VPRPAFIGTEPEAAGFRLAGVRVLVADERDPGELLRMARASASLVLISAAVAGTLPQDALNAAVLAGRPPIAVLPALIGQAPPPDMAHEVRAALGVL